MAKGLNRVTLLGNLGDDPEVRTTAQGTSVATLRIATSESYKDRSGEWQEITDWHRVILWDRLAETAEKYLKKGSKVLIEGRLKTRSYEKDGETRYITEVNARRMIMLDSRPDSGDSASRKSKKEEYDKGDEEHIAPDTESEEDDDIPF